MRLYAHAKTGMLWLDVRTPQRLRQSLGHRDIERGKQEAEKLAAALRSADTPRSADVTLKALFDSYEREVTPSKTTAVQKHDRRARLLFEQCWRATAKVKDLDRRDWDRYIHQRRSGQLRPEGSKAKRGVRHRQIEQDLRFVLAVFNWAETVRESGQPLLDRNPLRGFPVPSEQNINQPIATEEEVERMRAVAHNVDPVVPLFLELAYATGHRGHSIRLLRWSDIDFERGTIRWRAENDKMGHAHVAPADESVLEALRLRQHEVAAIGDAWVFPSPTKPSEPASRHLVRDWWKRLEREAQIEHVKGRGWHSLRRRFATDLDHLSDSKIMALGRWKTLASVVRYQKPSTEELREGLKTRRRNAAGESP